MTPFRIKASLPVVAISVSEQVSHYEGGPFLETSESFAISHGCYQPLNFLRYLTLSTQYPIYISG